MKNNFAYNSKTGKVENLMESGVVDSFDVVLGAVKSAIGVAAGVLTAGSVVLLPRQENDLVSEIAQKVAGMMQPQ